MQGSQAARVTGYRHSSHSAHLQSKSTPFTVCCRVVRFNAILVKKWNKKMFYGNFLLSLTFFFEIVKCNFTVCRFIGCNAMNGKDWSIFCLVGGELDRLMRCFRGKCTGFYGENARLPCVRRTEVKKNGADNPPRWLASVLRRQVRRLPVPYGWPRTGILLHRGRSLCSSHS